MKTHPPLTIVKSTDPNARLPYRLFSPKGRIGAYDTEEEALAVAEDWALEWLATEAVRAAKDAADEAAFSPRLRQLREAHLAAMLAKPDPELPLSAEETARRMALAIHRGGIRSVNTSSPWFRAAARRLGIPHTVKSFAAFLAS